MTRAIDRDAERFKQIVRGKIRGDLRKYISHGEMLGRKGGEVVSIPVPSVDIPHFRHGKKNSGGVGQGDGEEGQVIGRGGDPQADGAGEAGSEAGRHVREVEVTLDELAQMLGEALALPNIVPKGKDAIKTAKDRYNSIRRTGPDSLRHFKRTYKRALKRQISTGEYDPGTPSIVPIREDEEFRSWKPVVEPQANAAVIYMMDVSGSMTDEQKEIVRIEAFWIDMWLRKQYDGVQRRYVVHDAVAHEVDEETFYRTRESGGTRISTAYKAAAKILDRDFPPDDWNVYFFQFSDGDNWGEDNESCRKLLADRLLPVANLFCYGQVESPYGSGDYIRELRKLKGSFDNLVLSEIDNKDAILDSIKDFLGTGR